MGDMADMAVDQLFDEFERWENNDFDLDEGPPNSSDHPFWGRGPRQQLSCRYCKSTNVYWQKVDKKWRLFEDGKLHNCPVNPLK